MFTKKIFKGDKRSALLKKNIAGSFFIKGWNCIVQLLLVPLTLNCLNQYEYGIWLTINSILIWIDQFDIGLGNGLRNKLAESIAQNDKLRARKLVSTTIIMMFAIIIPFFFILLLIINQINLHDVLNVSPIKVPNLNTITSISLTFVCATFIFKSVGNIFLGMQLPAINNLLVVTGQTLILIPTALLSLTNDKSLLHIAIAYTLSPLIIYIIAYPITFRKYPFLRPSISFFDKMELKVLISLGINFFLIQMAGLIIFATSSVLISSIFSPAEVTSYQIAYRYFSITLLVFTVISAPLWSASTDAYTKHDITWIKKAMNKCRLLMLLFGCIIFIMLLISNTIYKIWLSNRVNIEWNLSITMAMYIMLLIYSTGYSNILFGIGKIKVITIVTITEAITFIPLTMLLANNFGVTGVVIASIIVNATCALTNKIQFELIINNKAKGIWNK